MTLVIKKYGGACFEALDGYRRVARTLAAAAERQVVVVSARKGVTDLLLAQAMALGATAGSAACDQLLATGELQSAALLRLALEAVGVETEVFRADEVFMTDGVAGDASILETHTGRIRVALRNGRLPLVPGFYGAGAAGEVATFGRGGSDYSAIALGVALGASHVELCKAEVDGIFDADPNVDAKARQFATLTHADALAIARRGGKVLQEKSAWLAMTRQLPVLVRPAFKDTPGTWVGSAGAAGSRRRRRIPGSPEQQRSVALCVRT